MIIQMLKKLFYFYLSKIDTKHWMIHVHSYINDFVI